MSLNGVDIANYQAGINIAAMTTTDFVIVKATQGTWYTSPSLLSSILMQKLLVSCLVFITMQKVKTTKLKQITS